MRVASGAASTMAAITLALAAFLLPGPIRAMDDSLFFSSDAREISRESGGGTPELVASFIPAGSGDDRPSPGPGGIGAVVLDPGHGGENAGARGGTGTLEKDLVLALARKVKSLAEERLGLTVVLTRTADYPVDLSERSAAANAVGDALFLSLHAGAGYRPEIGGVEVCVMAYPGREAGAGTPFEGGKAGTVAGRGGVLLTPVQWERAQEPFIPESVRLAERMSRALEPLSAGGRPVRRAPLAVLAAVRMPAVLVEVGCLTNPEQEIRLNRADHQDRMAEAIVQAIADHRRSELFGGAGESFR